LKEYSADIAIIGGGLGGVAAALGALRGGRTVVMTEQYDWIGGQMTSQAVPPDEHSWVEQFGITRSIGRCATASASTIATTIR
jgi:NADPH-dependent 2,4-dienoyl-CoA reductase/sulfur reductase-like enzyme